VSAARQMNPLLRLGLDLGPLLLFFIAYSAADIFYATGALMAAVTISVGINFAIERKVAPMPLITLVLVLIFGGLTLWLANENFIKVKPTILYAIFAAVLLIGLAMGRIFLKTLLAQSLRLPESAWRALTWRWAVFFLCLAVTNEIVWRNFSDDVWVAFKVWGVFPLTLLFAVAQTPFISRHLIQDDASSAGR